MKINQKGFNVVEALLTIIIISLIGFVGWFVFSATKTTKKLESSAKFSATPIQNSQAKQTNTAVDQLNSTKLPASNSSKSVEPSDAVKLQIQTVATAYLHRISRSTDTDTPNFKASEKTLTSEDGKFAIQYYCGVGECSQVWLKKVGNTWVPLGEGIEIYGTTLLQFNKDYDWPLNFF